MIFKIKFDDIEVEVTKIDIQQNYNYINFGPIQHAYPSKQSAKMIGLVSNKDYMKLDKWFNGIFNNHRAASPCNYKKNIIFNTVQIMGIFPTEYSFNQNGIEVTFSIDYFAGDINLFKLKQLRKEKLIKLNSYATMQ